ncbi:MAG: hypothetical protein ACRDJI_02175, partial [Actinomycetota bacterium]
MRPTKREGKALYDPLRHERDACGIGFVADARGRSSRAIVDAALDALCRVRHRGAVAADALTGDGAGVLLPVPRRLLANELAPGAEGAGPTALGGAVDLGLDPDRLGVAMVFCDPDETSASRGALEAACAAEGLTIGAWRAVPVDGTALGA